MPQPRLDEDLLNRPGGRLEISTPALVLDLDALEANIAAMAGWAKREGIGLRPHAKTHKCAAIGRLQMQAGALGLCCAKLAEAEALAAARSEEHTSELQSLMRISYAVFCLKKKNRNQNYRIIPLIHNILCSTVRRFLR